MLSSLYDALATAIGAKPASTALEGHSGHVWCLALTDTTIFSGSADGTVRGQVFSGHVDAILQGLSAATAGLPATLPPTSEPTKEFVARQHTKLAPYKPHAPGASSSFHDALSPGGADPLKERADDLLRAMV